MPAPTLWMEAQLRALREKGCRLRYAEYPLIPEGIYLKAAQALFGSERSGPGPDTGTLFQRGGTLLREAVELLQEMQCRSVPASALSLQDRIFPRHRESTGGSRCKSGGIGRTGGMPFFQLHLGLPVTPAGTRTTPYTASHRTRSGGP